MVYDRSIEEKTTGIEMKSEGGGGGSKETRNRDGLDEAEEDVGEDEAEGGFALGRG